MGIYRSLLTLRRANYKWLVGLVVVAFLLRAFGVWGDWPFGFLHIDEGLHIRNATQLMQDGTVSPDNLVYPTAYPALLVIPIGFSALLGLITGYFSSADNLVARFLLEPGFAYVGARVWTALFGAMTVALVFQIGRQAYGIRTGWIAAVLLAVSALHVEFSHYALPEVQVGLLVTASLLFCLRYVRSPNMKELLIAGALFGLAVSTKQTALPVALPLVIAWIYARSAVGNDRRWVSQAIAGALAAVLLFAVTSPVYLTQFSTALSENIGSGGEGGFSKLANGKIGLFDGLDYVWTFQMWLWKDWALTALAIAGLALAAYRHSKSDIVLGSFAVGLFGVAATLAVHQVHYIVPVLPVMFVFAGRFADWGLTRLRAAGVRAYGVAVTLLLVALLLTGTRSVALDIGLAGTDTRMQAREWVLDNVAAGSNIVVTNTVWSPPLHDRDSQRFQGQSALGNATVRGYIEDYLAKTPTYVVTEGFSGADGVLIPVERWAGTGWEYVVVSSFVTDEFLVNEPPPAGNPLRSDYEKGLAFYLSLQDSPFIEELVRFTPSFRHPGPSLVIYRVLETAGGPPADRIRLQTGAPAAGQILGGVAVEGGSQFLEIFGAKHGDLDLLAPLFGFTHLLGGDLGEGIGLKQTGLGILFDTVHLFRADGARTEPHGEEEAVGKIGHVIPRRRQGRGRPVEPGEPQRHRIEPVARRHPVHQFPHQYAVGRVDHIEEGHADQLFRLLSDE